MENESLDEIKKIHESLCEKESIKYNPFSSLPKSTLAEAVKVLEEYSEEITIPLSDSFYK